MCEGRKSYYVFDESSKGGNAGLLGAALDRCSCLITVTKLQTSRSFLGKVAAPRAACVRATPDSISLSSIHREQDPPSLTSPTIARPTSQRCPPLQWYVARWNSLRSRVASIPSFFEAFSCTAILAKLHSQRQRRAEPCQG